MAEQKRFSHLGVGLPIFRLLDSIGSIYQFRDFRGHDDSKRFPLPSFLIFSSSFVRAISSVLSFDSSL